MTETAKLCVLTALLMGAVLKVKLRASASTSALVRIVAFNC